ncbi:PEP-CTERM sorting domain-containing protein [Quisquiliibacterium transsilvanicum]|uniref:PEP-CTERM sorting domain-containing protein n=1 Tax=Quisquiliibacterium transsilvanicum TaxID=1549638 RepID=A0A7W8HDJ4_9BURK|nr:PEP-CTERM sorting domain-containing protein [Quisquiliibacterium transsilvanicum]MBB5270077.1 hypothetical protein [Quisquiliibacterium transsilvanicum]
MNATRCRAGAGFLVAALGFLVAPAQSETIVTDFNIVQPFTTQVYNDRIGNSRFFFGANSDLLRIAAFVLPSPDSDTIDVIRASDGQVFRSTNGYETTVTANHVAGFPNGTLSQSLRWSGLESGRGGGRYEYQTPFVLSDPAVQSLIAAWDQTPFTITVQNPRSTPTSVTVTAPDYDPSSLPPFLTDVAVTGGGLKPTLSWTVPDSGVTPESVRIQVRLITGESPDGTRITSANLVHDAQIPIGTNSYSFEGVVFSNAALSGFPSGLEVGSKYEIAVVLEDRAGGTAGGAILGRARTFFEFTPLPDDTGNVAVYLPNVGPDGVWKFDVKVTEGQRIAIDPYVAIGYEYQIGSGDPFFRSVLLPDIGDGLYELYLFDGSDWVMSAALVAGQEHFFGGIGVDRFRVLGIEPGAGLDPTDVSAFVTTLTFMGDGRFTGSMRALVAEVSEPGTVALFGAAVLAMGLRRRQTGR